MHEREQAQQEWSRLKNMIRLNLIAIATIPILATPAFAQLVGVQCPPGRSGGGEECRLDLTSKAVVYCKDTLSGRIDSENEPIASDGVNYTWWANKENGLSFSLNQTTLDLDYGSSSINWGHWECQLVTYQKQLP
jgi:hypothetical protein